MADIDAYLERIRYEGPREPTLPVLAAVHRHHAYEVPYENLDVLRRLPVSQDIEAIFDKIVHHRRGGWCYEMNGLLGWALAELGFNVTRQLGGVMRSERGDDAFGNHLMLKVSLDGRTWLADVGLGDGIAEPIPLEVGDHRQGARTFRLETLGGGIWRYHNADGAMPPDFDFRYREGHSGFSAPEADEGRIAEICGRLQTDPESMFRLNLVCQRMSPDGISLLLGRVFTHNGKRRLLDSASELDEVLSGAFGLAVDTEELWPGVVGRHDALFGDTAIEEIRFGAPDPEN